MCGIVGSVAVRNVTDILVDGLRRLEYRGYDSAGVAVISQGALRRARVKGKVNGLDKMFEHNPLSGNTGIAHTRWATHGVPGEKNAHPHMSHDEIAVVHNGIIENHEKLRERCRDAGYVIESDTDTEIIAHLVHLYYEQSNDLLKAVQLTVAELEGAYALAIISVKEPHRMIAVRKGSPLVVGIGYDENYVASDHIALLPVTQKFIYVHEGDIADICHDAITLYDHNGELVKRPVKQLDMSYEAGDKGEYRHYMRKRNF
jgi:glutamine---fructose-6-phosphate transaminase (isomerizing)